MRKNLYLTLIISISFIITSSNFSFAAESMAQKLSGRLLLQVESLGEAWYVNPKDLKRYYLKRPDDAFEIMKKLSIGITDDNLNKIPIGLADYNDLDSDNDGLSNRLEEAIGTNINFADSDADGYGDKEEIINNYNPSGAGSLPIDKNYSQLQSGKIFLQVSSFGEAWYVNPIDNKKYYLGRPSDAFLIMRTLSLGITNFDLNKINIGYISIDTPPPPCATCNAETDIIYKASDAIRSGNTSNAVSYFIEEKKELIEYTMNFLDSDGKLTLANMMSGSKLTHSTATQKTYYNEIYFSLGGSKVPIYYYVKKQEDGTWLLTNL